MKIPNLILVATLLTVLTGSSAQSQGGGPKPRPTPPLITAKPKDQESEFVYAKIRFKYYSNNTVDSVQFLIIARNTRQFLADPLNTLRQQGIVVPPSAEPHWKALSVVLRRLANPHIPPPSASSKAPKNISKLKSEIARLQIPGGWIPIVGDWNGDGTNTVGAHRIGPNDFLADPVGTLRAQGVKVPTADEPAWRQLADAFKELRRAYLKWDDIQLKRGRTE